MVAIEERGADLESRMSRLEGVIEQINLRLEDVNARMTSLENSLNARMNSLENSLNTRMNVHIALTFAIWASVVGLLLVIMFRG